MTKKRTRLTSTKRFFDMNLSSSRIIHAKVTSSIDKNIEVMNRLLSDAQNTEDAGEISKISRKLSRLLAPSNYQVTETDDKLELVSSLKKYRGLELIVRRSAATNAVVSIYASFEDFIRQTMLKYYEDDVRRLHDSNKTIKYSELVPLVISDELLLRNIAYDLVDNVIRGSVRTWTEQLIKMGFKDLVIGDPTRELILVRNAIVHNSARATKELVYDFPDTYTVWKRIDISDKKLEDFFNSTHKTVTWLQGEYSRTYKTSYSNWNEPNYGIKPIEMDADISTGVNEPLA